MSVLRDIYGIGLDLHQSLTNGSNKDKIKSIGRNTINVNMSNGSIRKVSKGNIAQFPVICTRGVDINTARMVNSALESDYALMVFLSIDNMLRISNTHNSAASVLSRFHTGYDTIATDITDRNLITVRESVARYSKELLCMDSDKFITESLNNMSKLSEKTFKPNNVDTKGSNTRLSAKMMTDMEVKKNNEIAPTLMQVNIKLEGDTTAIPVAIGVKTVLHPVTPDEIVKNMTSGVVSNRSFFNFVKATTGEMAFLKDYIFAYSKMKADAMGERTQSRWWNTLKRRASSDRVAKLLKRKEFIPNATIVMSIEEADEILTSSKIDVFKKSEFSKLFKEYFLLGIVIVDETNAIAHIAYDGDDSFEPYSFNALQSKKNNPSNDIKTVLSALQLNGR